jgi:hypothetical protein
LCRDSAELYGNSFTYTLLTEQELRKHLESWLFIVSLILTRRKKQCPNIRLQEKG